MSTMSLTTSIKTKSSQAKDHEQIAVFVSTISVLNNWDKSIEAKCSTLLDFLQQRFQDFEIIIIHTGLQRLQEEQQIDRFLESHPCVRFLYLNNDLHADIAYAAGMNAAIGDYTITLDLLHDDHETIADLVSSARNGNDFVVGVDCSQKDNWFIAKLLTAAGIKKPVESYFCCISRQTMNKVIQDHRKYRQLFFQIAQHAGTSDKVLCHSKSNALRLRNFNFWFNYLIFNSTKPLKWITIFGFMGSFFGVLFGSYSIVIRFIKDSVVEGWTTTIFFISLFFSMLFLILTIFSSYLGRILDEQGDKRPFSITKEKTSKVMINQYNLNIKDKQPS